MPRKPRLQPLARAVLRTQSDHRLVTLVRDGKEAAFEEIVRRYRAPLVAFAAAYGPPDPEDVVQESLIRSWDALRESSGEMNLKPWLYTIVRNRALNARRDSRPHEPLTEGIDGVPQPPEIALSNDELRRAVAAIGALPVAQREALVRSALEGHTHDQIAAAIGSTPGAVRQLIYRARMTVRHGVGAVIPLPLVAALAELGTGGAGAAAGGAAAAGAAGGGSLAAKTALVAAIGAVAIGSGAAIKQAGDADKASDPVHRTEAQRDEAGGEGNGPTAGAPGPDATGPAAADSGRRAGEGGSSGSDDGSGDDSGGGSGDDGSASSGEESGSSGEGSGSTGSGSGDDSSGPGSGGDDDSPDSGSGSTSSGSSDSDDSVSGHSGSGDSGSGSGSDGGDSSGSGSGGETTVSEGDNSGFDGGGESTTTTTVPELENSGSGSGELELPEIN